MKPWLSLLFGAASVMALNSELTNEHIENPATEAGLTQTVRKLEQAGDKPRLSKLYDCDYVETPGGAVHMIEIPQGDHISPIPLSEA